MAAARRPTRPTRRGALPRLDMRRRRAAGAHGRRGAAPRVARGRVHLRGRARRERSGRPHVPEPHRPGRRRAPTDAEWADVRRGLSVARLVADAGIGQAVVIKHGAVTAVEATEGTTETIRRGLAQAGAGAVVVKAAAREHDYRFDTPGVGP